MVFYGPCYKRRNRRDCVPVFIRTTWGAWHFFLAKMGRPRVTFFSALSRLVFGEPKCIINWLLEVLTGWALQCLERKQIKSLFVIDKTSWSYTISQAIDRVHKNAAQDDDRENAKQQEAAQHNSCSVAFLNFKRKRSSKMNGSVCLLVLPCFLR